MASPAMSWKRRTVLLIALLAWVFVSFAMAQVVIVALIWLLKLIHVPFGAIDPTVLETAIAALIYIVTLGLVIGLPWLLKKRKTTLNDVGLDRLPTWTDVLMAPAGLVIYFVLSASLTFLATSFLPWFNASQPQDTGFSQLNFGYEYFLAFITLVVIAPVAEETIFRGYLLGKLRKFVPVWVAILATSVLFGAVHGAWNLAIDTFALSVVMSLLRQNTGSLWASILLHMTKNGIAFYILFINPTLLHTLGA